MSHLAANMTDRQISFELAKTIGWIALPISDAGYEGAVMVYNTTKQHVSEGKVFDYRDWNVIGPIAERYRCFPEYFAFLFWKSHAPRNPFSSGVGQTPQKAIALAVISTNRNCI